jgi:FkbM family methyltransferase
MTGTGSAPRPGFKTVLMDAPGGLAPLSLSGNASDQSVVGAIEFAGGAYEPHVTKLLASIVRNDSVCLDIGANIGAISLVLGRLARAGRVYAFEPGATNYQFLVDNIETNHLANIAPVNVGLLDRTTDVEFCYVESVAGCSFIPGNDVREGVIERIHCVTLDQWVIDERLTRLDVVKLDAEGAEIAVLQGGSATIARFRPALVIEFNPTPMQRFWQRDARELYDLLKASYDRIQVIDSQGGGLRPVKSYSDLEAIVAAGRGWEDLFCTATTR